MNDAEIHPEAAPAAPRLSVVIICWNDLGVIADCLRSVYDRGGLAPREMEVIVSDNGSTDGSVEHVREHHPEARLLLNGQNLGFARGNNAGIAAARGEYVLILNPDTIVHGRALRDLVDFADRHPDRGGFGCRVLNPDGTYQHPARPFPTAWRYLVGGLCLRRLGRLPGAAGRLFTSDLYPPTWVGESERDVDWQMGCCVLVRRRVLEAIGGFDERFFYNFEEVDLCRRIAAGHGGLRYTPEAVITHLGGGSTSRFKTRFEIEKLRNRLRYFYKHFGMPGAQRARRAALAWFAARRLGYGARHLLRRDGATAGRLAMYRTLHDWLRRLDLPAFLERGEEPDVGHEPVAAAPDMTRAPAHAGWQLAA